MTEVKCIACNKLNSAGDRFCAGCGSSLDLQLCGACEAINNPVAESCHSCGKPLVAQAVVASAVELAEAPEAPFYPPRRWEVYDVRPSLASRLGHAAKLTLFVALPLAAIAVWAHQLYGERLFRGSEPSAQMPAAAGVTAPVPEPVVQAKPPVVETKPSVVETKQPAVETKQPVAETKQPVAETKRPLAQAQAPAAAPAKRTRTITHTAVTAVAPAPAAPVLQDKPPAVEAPSAAPMTRGRVTHTRASALAPAAPALPAAPQPAAAQAPAAAGCPEAVAVLGLCTSNRKGEGN
jgi:hypothetical protein